MEESGRLGFLGGSFDPPHWGHLLIAQDALEQAGLDRVYFVPAAQSPLKAHTPHASAQDRLQMLELALGDDPRFGVLDWELGQPPPSYTRRTVGYLRKTFPDAELHWIIGADQFQDLDRWHEIEQLKDEVTFLVLARPGFALGESPVAGLRWQLVRGHLFDVSSRELRHRIVTGKPIDFFCPPRLGQFFKDHPFYRA